MNIALRRKNDRAPLLVSLSDQAISYVGTLDARRAQSLTELRDFEKRLEAQLEQVLRALSTVRLAVQREEAADSAMEAFAEADEAVERAISEFKLDDPKPVSRPSKSKKTEVA